MEEDIQNGEGVSLKQIMLLIRANALIIALCLLLGVAAGLGYYFVAKPSYTATQALSITCKDDEGVSRMSTAYLNTIVESCRQNTVIEEANRLYSPDGSVSRAITTNRVNVTYDDERVSYYIYISYTDNDADIVRAKLAALTEAVSTVGADLASDVITYNVTVNPATEHPDLVTKSNRTTGLLLGILAGAVLAFFAVLVRHLADSAVKTKEQLEQVTGAKTFAVLQDGAEEGARRLSDNVLFLTESGEHKSIEIASAFETDGASDAAAALAVRLGASGKRVLVVDANFFRPCMHRLLGVENTLGLSGYVAGRVSSETAIAAAPHENVFLLPQGENADNPSAILISDKFRELLAEAKEQYDVVLLDVSPVLQSSEYLHVSPLSDAAIFFAAHGAVKKAHAAEAVAELKRSGAKVAGAVFTRYNAKIGRSVGYKGDTFYAEYDPK
ncbi:MAG: hypothetical protein DBX59_03160 [Bacillota bacterium]|nr:MAG: hypothetical protein DBX59_03160 [Bacillota bacterium]